MLSLLPPLLMRRRMNCRCSGDADADQTGEMTRANVAGESQKAERVKGWSLFLKKRKKSQKRPAANKGQPAPFSYFSFLVVCPGKGVTLSLFPTASGSSSCFSTLIRLGLAATASARPVPSPRDDAGGVLDDRLQGIDGVGGLKITRGSRARVC